MSWVSSAFKKAKKFIGKEYNALNPKISVGGKKYSVNPFGATNAAVGDAASGKSASEIGGNFAANTNDFGNTAKVIAPLAVAGAVSGTGVDTPAGGTAPGGAGSSIPQALDSFLPKNPDGSTNWGSLFDKGLGAAQLINAANLQKQSTDYAKSAFNTANESYGARAPLRVAGIEGMLHPQTQDLSSLSQIPGNPFARRPIPVNQPTSGTVGMAPISVPAVNARSV